MSILGLAECHRHLLPVPLCRVTVHLVAEDAVPGNAPYEEERRLKGDDGPSGAALAIGR